MVLNERCPYLSCNSFVEIDCLGFFEEIVRRIEVTFRRAQTQVKAERKRYSNLIIVLFYQGKRRKRREKTYNGGYI
jgi:hypothetical protein